MRSRCILAGALALGACLRIIEYVGNPPLWGDEAMLYASLHRPLGDLVFRTLDYHQTAPPGFLLLEQLAVLTFGTSEYALRLVPLLAALAALGAFALLARAMLRGWAVPLAVLLFSLSPYLIHYGSEVKQYSTDALVSVLVLLATVRAFRATPTPGGLRQLGFGGVLAAGFSQPAVLTLGVLLALVVIRQVALNRPLREIALLGGVWAGGIVIVGLWSLTVFGGETIAYMRSYWSQGFLPFPPMSVADVGHYAASLVTYFQHPGGLAVPLTGLAALACGVAVRRREWTTAVLLAPLLAAMGGAMTGLYPIARGRLLLFTLPSGILLMSAGVSVLLSQRSRLARASGVALGSALCLQMAVGAFRGLPRNDLHAELAHVAAHRQPDDEIVVPRYLIPLVAYYAEEFGLGDVTVLHDSRRARETAGRRWFMYSWPATLGGSDNIVASLETTGRVLTRHQLGPGLVVHYERVSGVSSSSTLGRPSVTLSRDPSHP